MKRRILALLLAVLTLTALTTAACAAEATEGVYNIRIASGCKLTVEEASPEHGFYANASKFKLSCENMKGKYSLIFLINADTGDTIKSYPTETNLYYIDQKNVEATTTFDLLPKEMANGTYHVYVSTDGTDGLSLKKVASFEYGEDPGYMLGDVNGDGAIDTTDALWILQHYTQKRKLSSDVADVDDNGDIDTIDALKVLQYYTQKITYFTY